MPGRCHHPLLSPFCLHPIKYPISRFVPLVHLSQLIITFASGSAVATKKDLSSHHAGRPYSRSSGSTLVASRALIAISTLLKSSKTLRLSDNLAPMCSGLPSINEGKWMTTLHPAAHAGIQYFVGKPDSVCQRCICMAAAWCNSDHR